MKQLLEELKHTLSKRLESYTIENVYKYTFYAFVYASLIRQKLSTNAIKGLRKKIPPPLVAEAASLRDMVLEILNTVDAILNSNKAVIVEESNLNEIINELKQRIERIDAVVVYDCMSLLEQIILASYLEKNNVKSTFLDIYFVNPTGKTWFMTQQLSAVEYQRTLMNVAKRIAEELKAQHVKKSSQIDLIVHEKEYNSLEEFMCTMSETVKVLAEDVLRMTRHINRILIFSDHGYDLVFDPFLENLLIIHGYRKKVRGLVLIPFSKITFFIAVTR